MPGDTDYDGDVDLADLGTLSSNYGRTGDALWKFGDFDLDFDVDLSDLGMLASNYSGGQAQAFDTFAQLSNTPEPTSIAILALFMLPLLPSRRRHR
jgi:hypothetical protein